MKGIIVGCDYKQEWLLPWWWERYSAHNRLPVIFFDFGMTERARKWCEERGEVRGCPAPSPSKKVLKYQEEWEKRCGEGVWEIRSIWLQKPRACFLSPFQKSLWIDLDCEIRGKLHPLFDALGDADLALAKDPVQRQLPHVVYNSGVVVFRKGPIIDRWLEETESHPDDFLSDQEHLNLAIAHYPSKWIELSPIYNWSCRKKGSEAAVIVHYLLAEGKTRILNQIAASQFLETVSKRQFL